MDDKACGALALAVAGLMWAAVGSLAAQAPRANLLGDAQYARAERAGGAVGGEAAALATAAKEVASLASSAKAAVRN